MMLFVAIVWYLGVFSSVALLLVLYTSIHIGRYLFGFRETFLQFSAGFFLLFQVYVGVSILSHPSNALWTILLLSVAFSVYDLYRQRLLSKKSIWMALQKLDTSVGSLSVIEILIIILAFIYGSFPQSSFNWDSVYANLYNAKWYIQIDSLKPIEESISSFFPQHAVLYYSMFYAIGGFRTLQVAYLLPFFLVMCVVRTVLNQVKTKPWFRWFTQLLLFTPIVIMQTTSGYYDLFIASLIMLSVYLLYYAERANVGVRIFTASLFLGVASASKIFPLAYTPALFAVFLDKKVRSFFQTWPGIKKCMFMGACVVVLLAPLSYWMWRSFAYTGSPIFPLFQNVFPTQELWSSSTSVNENPMTQTTMSAESWVLGGFILYPILTYFRTEGYLEGTRGFPGIIYILLLPLQIFSLSVALRHLWKRRMTNEDLSLLVCFVGMLMVGLVARYYRYMWPFQVSFAVFSCAYMWKYIRRVRIPYALIVVGIAFFYLIHVIDLADSLRFSPVPQKRQLLSPEAMSINPQDTMWDTIIASNTTKPTLDASPNALPRVYLPQRSYQCSWYWTAGDKKVTEALHGGKEDLARFMRQFSFVIASSDPDYVGTYCDALIRRYPNLEFVLKNASYTLYAVH